MLVVAGHLCQQSEHTVTGVNIPQVPFHSDLMTWQYRALELELSP